MNTSAATLFALLSFLSLNILLNDPRKICVYIYVGSIFRMSSILVDVY